MKVTRNVYLGYWIKSSKDMPQFNVFNHKLSDSDEHFLLVDTKAVEFEINDEQDFTPAVVKALRAQQETIRAEAQAALTKLDEHINSLLAIEHKESA